MPAADYDIEIERNATFERVITCKDENGDLINLTGYTAKMQGRKSHESSDLIFSLSESSGLTLGGSAGTISVNMTPATTLGLAIQSGVYDLRIDNGTRATRILKGKFTVSPEVSR